METYEIIFAIVGVLFIIAMVIYGIKNDGKTYTAIVFGGLAAFWVGMFVITKFDAHMTEEMGDEWHTSLLFIAVAAIAIAIYNIRRRKITERFQKMTSDCLEQLRDREMCVSGINRVTKEAYGDGYCVSTDSLQKILDDFESYIMDRFISGCTTATRKDVMISNHYFYLSLLNFLNNHFSDDSFCGNKMTERLCRIDDWHIKEKLTPFGLAYYKVYLAAATYCVNENIWPYTNIDSIKKSIDSGEVVVICQSWENKKEEMRKQQMVW